MRGAFFGIIFVGISALTKTYARESFERHQYLPPRRLPQILVPIFQSNHPDARASEFFGSRILKCVGLVDEKTQKHAQKTLLAASSVSGALTE